mmetsp:Transcript_116855/g.184828  ORF Transcript_116855/g.184828 Transcript_116855/m.184828 type:complete len:141 (-) Transcript_116855:53-475(-)
MGLGCNPNLFRHCPLVRDVAAPLILGAPLNFAADRTAFNCFDDGSCRCCLDFVCATVATKSRCAKAVDDFRYPAVVFLWVCRTMGYVVCLICFVLALCLVLCWASPQHVVEPRVEVRDVHLGPLFNMADVSRSSPSEARS